eukprot:2750576-Prymnesium_polylepis.1
MVKGRMNAVGETVHTQIVASHGNPVVVSAIEYVTQDGVSVRQPANARRERRLIRSCSFGALGAEGITRDELISNN